MGVTLRATTCLGDNTIPILREIVAALAVQGVDIGFDESLDAGEREELMRAGGADVVWACGLLTVEQITGGVDLEIVAAPVFAGESDATYRSVVVVAEESTAATVEDTMAGRLAVNEYGSWSGYRGFGAWLHGRGLSIDDYPTVVLTGSHRRSAHSILDGVADTAAIDHTVWDHLVATEPAIGRLRVLTVTDDWPAPPFAVRRDLVQTLAPAFRRLRPDGLESIVATDATPYVPMSELRAP